MPNRPLLRMIIRLTVLKEKYGCEYNILLGKCQVNVLFKINRKWEINNYNESRKQQRWIKEEDDFIKECYLEKKFT
jgi:hypothetical protein